MSCERIGKIIMTAASSRDVLVIVWENEEENLKRLGGCRCCALLKRQCREAAANGGRKEKRDAKGTCRSC